MSANEISLKIFFSILLVHNEAENNNKNNSNSDGDGNDEKDIKCIDENPFYNISQFEIRSKKKKKELF